MKLGFEKECKLFFRVETFFSFRRNRRQQELTQMNSIINGGNKIYKIFIILENKIGSIEVLFFE